MTVSELIALLPIFALGFGTVVTTVVVAFWRSHRAALTLTLITTALAFALLWVANLTAPQQATPLLMIDGYALFFDGLILAAVFAISLLTYSYLHHFRDAPQEMYVLLLTATLGATVLAASSHLASLFLGLELLSVPLFAMVAYTVHRPAALEAGVKYLILGALSSSLLLFGMALIFERTGTLAFAALAQQLSGISLANSPLVLTGLALITVGLGFKTSLVPFHLWTPDVYQGAPTPVTAFLASVSKTAVIAVLLRLFLVTGGLQVASLLLMLNVIAIASMIGGNLLALMQNDVKRIIAYSSVAHLGYLLVAFMLGGQRSVEAVSFYLTAYVVTVIVALGVVAAIANQSGARAEASEASDLQNYRGLFWRRPWLAVALTMALLSLAGIPLTMGFVGKFYLFAGGVAGALWPALAALIIGSVIGLFYYLRIIVAMASPAQDAEMAAAIPAAGLAGGAALVVLTLVLMGVGIYPTGLIDLIRASAGHIAASL